MADGDDNRLLEVQQLWQGTQHSGSNIIVSVRDLEIKLEVRKKLQNVRDILRDDLTAADLKWSLFVAACNSHCYEDMAEPFPTEYMIQGQIKDIDSLMKVIESAPPLSLLLLEQEEKHIYAIKPKLVNLLHWLLVETTDPYLKAIEPDDVDNILSHVSCDMLIPKPNRIFQVIYSANSQEEKSWKNAAKRWDSIYTCYGTKLENFFCVMHHGMKYIPINETLLGKQGIYLSSDLCDGIGRSPSGYGWGASTCGSRLCCVALCELADPEKFTCCVQSLNEELSEEDPEKPKIPETLVEKPLKHYNVTNPDMIRVRYLLIYNEKLFNAGECGKETSKGVFKWFRNHKIASFFFGYGMLLFGTWFTDIYFV